MRLKDGRQFSARLIGADDKTDIAVVKIDATDLPVEELADSDAVRVGEIACAIGVPYNLDYSFTTGVVSAKGRNKLGLSEPTATRITSRPTPRSTPATAAARSSTSTARSSA